MSRAATKEDLITAATKNFEKLTAIINELTPKELAAEFVFAADDKHKQAHWSRDKSLRDVLTHLYQWHQLLLNWVTANQNGDKKPFIPAPYNWKTYGSMNMEFWEMHQSTPQDKAMQMLLQSHNQVLALAQGFSSEELFSKGKFDWVGDSTLGTYFVSATASHYDWAIKKLKEHKKCCAK